MLNPATQRILCPRCHEPDPPETVLCSHCGYDMVLNNAGPRYYITRTIKAGGQGALYEAVGDDGQVYAVKEMLDPLDDPRERDAAVQRFEAEAGMLQRLRHPSIPRVYTNFTDENRHYLIMDFVRGDDLEDVVKRDGPIAEAQVLQWTDQLCDVLGYVHGLGLVYRDMKPSNVMIDREHGGIKLVDWGIAKVFQPQQRGTMIGTPGYAPPEQYQGLATQSSDIYALGATLHHLLTGRDPTLESPFTFPLVRDLNSSVAERTSAAIARALEFKPEARYPTIGDFCTALKPALRMSERPSVPLAWPKPVPLIREVPSAAAPVITSTVSQTSQPLALSTPQAPLVPARQATPRRSSVARWLAGVGLLGVLSVGVLLVLRGNTATPSLVPQVFEAQDISVILPPGTTDAALPQAFTDGFKQAAQQRFGPDVRIQPGPLEYSNGAPQQIGQEARGMIYRASVRGTVLLPQP